MGLMGLMGLLAAKAAVSLFKKIRGDTYMKWRRLGICTLIVVGLSGCSNLGVKPYQRDLLAEEDMQLNAHQIDQEFDDHIYFSKEASSGGRSANGGGCGCN